MNGKSIFIKYWLVDDSLKSIIQYQLSILPGLKKGISGSIIKGTNVGIIRDLPKEKEEEVLDMYKYFTSKEYQKKYSVKEKSIPVITELLDDKEICKEVPCDLTKNVQFIGEPKFIKEGPEDNKSNYKAFIHQFLYENKTIEETMKQIIDNVNVDMSSGATNNINSKYYIN